MGVIRAMAAGDAADVASLIRAAFAAIPVPVDPPPSGLRVTAEEVAAAGGGALWEDGGVQGCVLWREREGGLYVSRLAVRPGCRGRGIGRVLLAAAEAEGRRLGVPRLLLEVRLALAGNRRLFRAAGFVEGERRAHPGFVEATSVVAEKVL